MNLFREIERKDKEELTESDKEHFTRCIIHSTYSNWYPVFLIYTGVIVKSQMWQSFSILKYMNITYWVLQVQHRCSTMKNFACIHESCVEVGLYPSSVWDAGHVPCMPDTWRQIQQWTFSNTALRAIQISKPKHGRQF